MNRTNQSRFRLESGGIVAYATLLVDIAPEATSAFLASLPLERRLISAKWSGDVAVFHPGAGPLNDVDQLESPVTSIYPGAMVMRPRGSEVLIGYGVGEYRWGVGVDYTTRFAVIDTNRARFLAEIARTAREGSSLITIDAAGLE